MNDIINISELSEFKSKNSHIVNRKNQIDFKATVTWEIKGKQLYQEKNITVQWEQTGFNPGCVIVEALRPQNASLRYFTDFSPIYQEYKYCAQRNLLIITDSDYKVTITPNKP